MSIGTFGPLTFETSEKRIRTFDAFKRKTQSKWEDHNIIGLKAKTEFIAPGLDEISFQVVFSAYLGISPVKEIDSLREIDQKGEYHPLIIGGKTLGKFVITSVAEAWNRVDNQGNLLTAAVDLNLKEYIESSSKAGGVTTTVSAATTAAKATSLASKITSQAKGVGAECRGYIRTSQNGRRSGQRPSVGAVRSDRDPWECRRSAECVDLYQRGKK